MTRKVATRGRKKAEQSRRPAPRSTSRTGKKTASARAAHTAGPKPAERKSAGARKTALRGPSQSVKIEEHETDQVRPIRGEEDEDLDWLAEEEDPRSQIVEDDDELDGNHEEEW
jgi:hypothetical protein